MRRADRLFQLVQVLRNRRFATADDLAAALEVSKRTVYRDVRDLQSRGVPIIGEAGVGYRLQRGFELPPLTFNSDEIEALVLGARVVETWGDRALASASRSAMTKIEAVLPEPLRRILLDTLIFVPRGPRAEAVSSTELGELRRAVTERRKVHCEYRKQDDEETTRRVIWPLGLHFWGTKWSLAAWCELREGFRAFRPDRMTSVDVLETHFEPTDSVSLEAYLAHEAEEALRRGFTTKLTNLGPR